jgi:hypothetical protein
MAAAAAAIEADPCASICTLWNADIAAAAAMEMSELEALIGEAGGRRVRAQGLEGAGRVELVGSTGKCF